MPNYEVVSKESHINSRWKSSNNYMFTAKDSLCPLVMQEVPKAALHLPISFFKTGEHFGLFAVQGLEDGVNSLIDGQGNWLAGYIPAVYRGYPFLIANAEEEQVLCIDSDSGLIGQDEGEMFFDELSEPSPKLKEIIDFLTQVYADKPATQALCLLLEEHDLIEPWPITFKRNDKDVPVEGLFRVNETKFNTLDTSALTTLRDKGALPLIFCQLLSMQNLAHINRRGLTSGSTTGVPAELFDLSVDDGNISFEGF